MRPWELWRRTYVSGSKQGEPFVGTGDERSRAPEDAAMNWSLYTADRTTHLKIVVVGLAAALMIAVIGISARELNLGTDIMTAQSPTVIKAGGPVVFTDRSGPTVR
jgi:hypothetical protein